MASSPTPAFLRLAAHPLRWRLLSELAASDYRVRELVDLVGEPQNLVSYHLRLLRDGGLVSARRSTHDARDSYYHLDLARCADALAATANALHPALAPPLPGSPSAPCPCPRPRVRRACCSPVRATAPAPPSPRPCCGTAPAAGSRRSAPAAVPGPGCIPRPWRS
ncbi:ArsR/SmtB family transcription factor [[Actinomadura] parvosata]|uniref:ArsR/SmtB family transcription factor n=1 Tax=[Actinomadura] parvosata TaxID=1955412 RepID=UPI001FEBD87D